MPITERCCSTGRVSFLRFVAGEWVAHLIDAVNAAVVLVATVAAIAHAVVHLRGRQLLGLMPAISAVETSVYARRRA